MNQAAYMLASGQFSLKSVAEACGKSPATLGDLIKNAWFQETILEIQKENGATDIMEMFKSEVAASVLTLVRLRDDVKAPAAVQRAAATDILDRFLGKPTQTVKTESVPTSLDPVAEVSRLLEENARLKRPVSSELLPASPAG